MPARDWNAIAESRHFNIPPEAVDKIAPLLDALEASFHPLLQKLTPDVEPAIILSEPAVFGK